MKHIKRRCLTTFLLRKATLTVFPPGGKKRRVGRSLKFVQATAKLECRALKRISGVLYPQVAQIFLGGPSSPMFGRNLRLLKLGLDFEAIVCASAVDGLDFS